MRLGAGSEVSDRAAIRADEGSPIVIGENAGIDERVTFHVLEETNITVGQDVIIQGPASETEDPNNLPPAIPDGAVVTDEASLQEVLSDTPRRCRAPAALR